MELTVNNNFQDLDAIDRELIVLLQDGLPLCSRPYAVVAEKIGLDEAELIRRIEKITARGFIKRFGVIVRHHELGYQANAMVVWDIPDAQVYLVADRLKRYPFVTLCYRRPRRLPDWPYNLFCMIHGRDRELVLQQLDSMIRDNHWYHYSHDVLFSKRRFKQRGANYRAEEKSREATPVATEARLLQP